MKKKELRGWLAKPTPFKRASSDELPNPEGLRAHTSSFTINEMVNVVLGPNPPPYPEPSLLCGKTPRNSASLWFYIDDVFGASHSFHFLRVHFFPRMIWSRIKLMLSRLKLGLTNYLSWGKSPRWSRRTVDPTQVPRNLQIVSGESPSNEGPRPWGIQHTRRGGILSTYHQDGLRIPIGRLFFERQPCTRTLGGPSGTTSP